jgi:hypothetical protein
MQTYVDTLDTINSGLGDSVPVVWDLQPLTGRFVFAVSLHIAKVTLMPKRTGGGRHFRFSPLACSMSQRVSSLPGPPPANRSRLATGRGLLHGNCGEPFRWTCPGRSSPHFYWFTAHEESTLHQVSCFSLNACLVTLRKNRKKLRIFTHGELDMGI